VIDFGLLKELVGQWIDKTWDHTAILMRGDPEPAVAQVAQLNEKLGFPVYFMDEPPTVENIVQELARVARRLLQPLDVEVVAIRLWETPNCSATWALSAQKSEPCY
jgi:6-pyruvoyltetrahydropterin/6-carboxytetrahydropterin synthase